MDFYAGGENREVAAGRDYNSQHGEDVSYFCSLTNWDLMWDKIPLKIFFSLDAFKFCSFFSPLLQKNVSSEFCYV